MSSLHESELIIEAKALIHAPIDAVWELVSDTEKLDRALGLPPIVYEEIPQERGGALRIGTVKLLGMQSTYIDNPFEWVRNRFLSHERDFRKSVFFKKIYISLTFAGNGHFFEINIQIRVIPRHAGLKPFFSFAFRSLSRKWAALYARIENYYHERAKTPFIIKEPKLPLNRPQYEDIVTRLSKYSSDYDLNSAMARYILESPGWEIAKIRPYQAAKTLGCGKKAVLKLMLQGTREGIFDMNWDILCPSCRGAKRSSHSLKDVRKQVHCPSCNIDYEAEFDRNVELTFTVHPTIRLTDNQIYCFGSPANSSHILAQLRLAAGGHKGIELHLEEGMYKISSPQCRRQVRIEAIVDGGDLQATEIVFGSDEESAVRLQVGVGMRTIRFMNRYPDGEILVKLERTQWLENIVTAAEVTAMQEFRADFSSEVLQPGEKIGIRNITFLFTDLKNSTAFYSQVGDAIAFSVVRDHFDILIDCVAKYNGGVVKTIGDSVMAAFIDPIDALGGAIELQHKIHAFNATIPADRKIVVKSGLHMGPSLAVNLNETLDYFGHTVNVAARTNAQSIGDDIVITESLFHHPGVAEFLTGRGVRIDPFAAALKGISNPYPLYRIRSKELKSVSAIMINPIRLSKLSPEPPGCC